MSSKTDPSQNIYIYWQANQVDLPFIGSQSVFWMLSSNIMYASLQKKRKSRSIIKQHMYTGKQVSTSMIAQGLGKHLPYALHNNLPEFGRHNKAILALYMFVYVCIWILPKITGYILISQKYHGHGF